MVELQATVFMIYELSRTVPITGTTIPISFLARGSLHNSCYHPLLYPGIYPPHSKAASPQPQQYSKSGSLLVVLPGPLLGETQALGRHGRVTGDEFDLELPGDGNQRCLELVVIDIVGVWGVLLASHDFVGRQDPYQCRVQKARSNELA